MGIVSGGDGGSQTSVVGPFTVSFNDVGIATDGSLIVPLAIGTVVIAVACFITTAWNGGTTTLNINLGGSDYGPPDDDYGQLVAADAGSTSSGVGYGLSALWQGQAVPASKWGRLTTAGALIAYAPTGAPTQGQAKVYALVLVP